MPARAGDTGGRGACWSRDGGYDEEGGGAAAARLGGGGTSQSALGSERRRYRSSNIRRASSPQLLLLSCSSCHACHIVARLGFADRDAGLFQLLAVGVQSAIRQDFVFDGKPLKRHFQAHDMDVHCLATDKSMTDIRPEKMFRGAIIRDCVVKNVVDGKTLKASAGTAFSTKAKKPANPSVSD